MSEADLPNFDCPEEREVQPTSGPTLSIDLSSLFAADVYSSGTFDLSAISSSSIGKLLDALPIPVLLIDHWFQVGFANRSCERISSDYRKIKGVPFADLVPLPNDTGRAQKLTQKTQALIERAFETRRPQVSEAILEIDNNRIWARLHLRSVRIGLERHVLLIIEDLTHDKRQLILTQRNDEKYRKANFELGKSVDVLTEKVRILSKRLENETAQHIRTRRDLSEQRQAYDDLWDNLASGLVMIGNDGSVRRINSKFTQMFGYEITDLVDNKEWIAGWSGSGDKPILDSSSAWMEAFETEGDQVFSMAIEIVRKDGTAVKVSLSAVTLLNQEVLLIFDTDRES